MYLRPADLLDAAALARMRAASLIELAAAAEPDRPAFTAEATRAFVRLFREDRLAAWVLIDERPPAPRVVGSACAVYYDRLPFPDGCEHAEIAGVYVEPAYRGRGFASELVREAVTSAHGRGVRATFLRPATPGVQGLYERLGFRAAPFMRLEEPAVLRS